MANSFALIEALNKHLFAFKMKNFCIHKYILSTHKPLITNCAFVQCTCMHTHWCVSFHSFSLPLRLSTSFMHTRLRSGQPRSIYDYRTVLVFWCSTVVNAQMKHIDLRVFVITLPLVTAAVAAAAR